MPKFKSVLLAIAMVPVFAVASPKPAAAIDFGGIFSIGSSLAPFLSSIIGFDISPYESILTNSQDFVSAISSGNYGDAISSVGTVLGDYGIIDPVEFHDTVVDNATQQFESGAFDNFGGGLTLQQLQAIEDGKDATGDAFYSASLGADAQSNMVKSAEATADAVDASKQMAEDSAKSQISQEILKNQSGQLSIAAALSGQSLSEEREQGITLKMMAGTLNDIRANEHDNKRGSRKSRDRDTRSALNTVGNFAAITSGQAQDPDNFGGNN